MKYFLIIIAVLSLMVSGFAGYIVIQDKYFSASPAEVKPDGRATSSEIDNLKAQVSKLDSKINELQNLLERQSIFTQKMNEDILNDSARLIGLEKKFSQNLSSLMAESKDSSIQMQAANSQLNLSDPRVVKLIQDQVNETMKNTRQKQGAEPVVRYFDASPERIKQAIDDFAKNATLNDYQKLMFTRILDERKTKTTELQNQLRDKQITPEDYRTKKDTLKNDTNESIKSLLTAQQYEQYQKNESSFEPNAASISIQFGSQIGEK